MDRSLRNINDACTHFPPKGPNMHLVIRRALCKVAEEFSQRLVVSFSFVLPTKFKCVANNISKINVLSRKTPLLGAGSVSQLELAMQEGDVAVLMHTCVCLSDTRHTKQHTHTHAHTHSCACCTCVHIFMACICNRINQSFVNRLSLAQGWTGSALLKVVGVSTF